MRHTLTVIATAALLLVAAAPAGAAAISGTVLDTSGKPANGTVTAYLDTKASGELPVVVTTPVQNGSFRAEVTMTPVLQQAIVDSAGRVDMILSIVADNGYGFVRPFMWQFPDPMAASIATATPDPVLNVKMSPSLRGTKRLSGGPGARTAVPGPPPPPCLVEREKLSRYVLPVKIDALRTVRGARVDYLFSVMDGYTLEAGFDLEKFGVPVAFSIAGKKDTKNRTTSTTFARNGENRYVAASTIFEYVRLDFADRNNCPEDTTVDLPSQWAENLRKVGRPATSYRCPLGGGIPGSQPYEPGRKLIIDQSADHEIRGGLSIRGIGFNASKHFGKGTTVTYSFTGKRQQYYLCGPEPQKRLSDQRTIYMRAVRAR